MLSRMSEKMNSKGVTLVEVMISMAILLVVFMGLIQASLLSINHNMRNATRDEAVRIGGEAMSLLRAFNYSCGELNGTTGFKPLVTGTDTNCFKDGTLPTAAQKTLWNEDQFKRTFRGATTPITFTVTKEVDWLEVIVAPRTQPNAKRLIIRVEWQYPGETETQQHTIYYTMRNPAP